MNKVTKVTTDSIVESLDLAYDKLETVEAKRLLITYVSKSIIDADHLRWATEHKNIDDAAYKTVDEWIAGKMSELRHADTTDTAATAEWAISLADTGIARAEAFKS